ncbi:MAG: hypothetical protein QW507_02465 [Candidatus Nanoarchaeia archaeon]|nr:hypothetical protein [Candidatus Haiyanarchaeum thermophilum]MCW1303284.1 hypothetical protein [Candidatus Haiyanarchaeum thermophilum]MCW1303984.1 hypothetical protein [Candidatus Haiyanarchaeum thermophilum]MCW1306443.1 hypothetical protein [Candidatus Haiyanarchaeum thermophilum]MCW1307259.1 hypothetical protein [Candidatus Haiyanarchaeum thermophilum]
MLAQELPLASIALVILALIILLLILVFVFKINPLAQIFKLITPGKSEELDAFVQMCETYCIQANGSYHPISNSCPLFCTAAYDSRPFNGVAEDHCYTENGDVVKVTCEILGSDGNRYSLNSTTCKC